MFKPPIGRLFCCMVFISPSRSVIRNSRSEVVIGKAGMRHQEVSEAPLEAI